MASMMSMIASMNEKIENGPDNRAAADVPFPVNDVLPDSSLLSITLLIDNIAMEPVTASLGKHDASLDYEMLVNSS